MSRRAQPVPNLHAGDKWRDRSPPHLRLYFWRRKRQGRVVERPCQKLCYDRLKRNCRRVAGERPLLEAPDIPERGLVDRPATWQMIVEPWPTRLRRICLVGLEGAIRLLSPRSVPNGPTCRGENMQIFILFCYPSISITGRGRENFINPFQIEVIVTIFNHEDWFWKRLIPRIVTCSKWKCFRQRRKPLKTHPFSRKIYDFLQLWRTKRVIAIRQLNTLPLSGPLIFAPISSNAITLPKLNPYHSSQLAFQFKSRANSSLFCLSVVDNS